MFIGAFQRLIYNLERFKQSLSTELKLYKYSISVL